VPSCFYLPPDGFFFFTKSALLAFVRSCSVMEYVECGSIMQGKEQEDPVAEPRARLLFRQLVFGLEYCTESTMTRIVSLHSFL
jgi:hypothetical protein